MCVSTDVFFALVIGVLWVAKELRRHWRETVIDRNGAPKEKLLHHLLLALEGEYEVRWHVALFQTCLDQVRSSLLPCKVNCIELSTGHRLDR
jgi:hypothetical protein